MIRNLTRYTEAVEEATYRFKRAPGCILVTYSEAPWNAGSTP